MTLNRNESRTLFSIFSQILLIGTLIVSCGKKAPDFLSKEILADKAAELINKGDLNLLLKMTIQKDEFIDVYYKHLPEANQKGALSGEDFYRLFIGMGKINAAKRKIKMYGNRIISVKNVGEPESIIKTDDFNLLRKIPVTIVVRDPEGKELEITDNEILGAVIEKDNKYKLMNIFK